jgi:hypothetical protein
VHYLGSMVNLAKSEDNKTNLTNRTNLTKQWYRLMFYIVRATVTKGRDPCWEYKPHKNSNYIGFKTRDCKYFTTKSTLLHRFVYAVFNDKALTKQDVIMHTCDNRICINPKHLQLGTIQTNNADRDRKRKLNIKRNK